jgi:hypothetical protein
VDWFREDDMKRTVLLVVALVAAVMPSAKADEKELVGYWRVMGRGPADTNWIRADPGRDDSNHSE